jgi:REP element-mobilizing transposase RayT
MARRVRRPRQTELTFRTWGGKRKGAGRPAGEHPRVLHRARPAHKGRNPVHVTLRATGGLPSFRSELVEKLLCRVLNAQRKRSYEPGFQVVHFSIQKNHLHLVVEADDDKLRTGVAGLMISFARRLNRILRRKGSVWGDRYHRHDLATPREVHNTLNYVFNNLKKHGYRVLGTGFADPYSSASRFEGWSMPVFQYADTEPWPQVRARTWLLAQGWKKIGPLDPQAIPGRRSR